MPKEPERGGGRNEVRKKVTAADNGGSAGDADYMGDVRLESLFEFAPVGALTYEGWQIRPVGSGLPSGKSRRADKGRLRQPRGGLSDAVGQVRF